MRRRSGAARAGAEFFNDWIQKPIRLLDTRTHFENAEHKQKVVDLFRRAIAIYEKVAEGE
jgi:hypothetical protein